MTTWTPLPEGTGAMLAAAGPLTAAAQLGRLSVWSDDKWMGCAEADMANPARPRITGRQVYWGHYVVDVDGGTRCVAATPVALPGYQQTAHAWAPSGDAAVVSATRTGPGSPPAVVALLDAGGLTRARLWEASDLAPAALWFGPTAIVVGTRDVRVFDTSGALLRTLPADTSPFRVEADAADVRVLVAEHTRLAVRALHTSELVGECSGRWIDAALGPDGSRLVAIDFAGRIRVHLVEPELPVAYEIPADTPAQAVAASDDRIAVAFIEPPLVRTAALPDA